MKKFLKFIYQYYLLLMAAIFILVLWLNWHSYTMLVVYAYYIDFKNIILSGFDASHAILCTPTFPMWGYGWLLLLTENKLILLLLQGALTLFTVWYTFRFFVKHKVLNPSVLLYFKLILVISVPFYAFHTVRWPYSITVSLVVLSLILFIEGLFYEKAAIKKIILSGILFGLALNFRSDYYLVPVGFVVAALLLKPINWNKINNTAIWVVFIFLMLVPWGLYTYKTTGHFLLTSTNSGHVFFVGLGNLPDNKWGITQWDQDSVLREVMFEKYNKPKSTLLYETNKYLTNQFFERVQEDPEEYYRKILYSTKKLLTEGVYPGDFHNETFLKIQPLDSCWTIPGETWEYETAYYQRKVKYKGVGSKVLKNPSKIFNYIEPVHLVRIITKKFSTMYGKITTLLAFLLLPFAAFYAIREKNHFIIFSLLLILYQSAINIFAYSWNLYTANVYFFLLLIIPFTIHKLYKNISGKFLKHGD